MSQQDPDAVVAQVVIALAMIGAVVIVALALFVFIGYVVHRTADSPSRRTVAVLTSIGSIMAVLPPIVYALSHIYGV